MVTDALDFGTEEAVVGSEDGPVALDLSGPVVLDLGAVKDEPVGIGWHFVRIEQVDPKLSSQKQLPSFFVLSRIVDENDPEYNRTVIWNLMLSGDGMLFTKRCFKALGLPEQLDYPSYQALADVMIGLEVVAQVKHQVHEGTKRAKVNNWRQPAPEIEIEY